MLLHRTVDSSNLSKRLDKVSEDESKCTISKTRIIILVTLAQLHIFQATTLQDNSEYVRSTNHFLLLQKSRCL